MQSPAALVLPALSAVAILIASTMMMIFVGHAKSSLVATLAVPQTVITVFTRKSTSPIKTRPRIRTVFILCASNTLSNVAVARIVSTQFAVAANILAPANPFCRIIGNLRAVHHMIEQRTVLNRTPALRAIRIANAIVTNTLPIFSTFAPVAGGSSRIVGQIGTYNLHVTCLNKQLIQLVVSTAA